MHQTSPRSTTPQPVGKRIQRLVERMEVVTKALDSCDPNDFFWIKEYTAVLDDLENELNRLECQR